jgi:hypothetical protein
MVEPGDAPERHPIAALLNSGQPMRGWCSAACFNRQDRSAAL